MSVCLFLPYLLGMQSASFPRSMTFSFVVRLFVPHLSKLCYKRAKIFRKTLVYIKFVF